MLCDICSKNSATVHLTEIIGGKITEVHLCEDCAKKKTEEFQKQFSIADFLSELVDMEGAETISLPKIACSHCGLTYKNFKETGRLGCPKCYEAFGTQLQQLIRKIHGSLRHRGKSPTVKMRKEVSVETRIKELKSYLERAIKLEEYEEAARIRDEMRILEKKIKKQPPK